MIQRAYPEYISFTDAAELLVRLNLVSSMTPRGLRYMARARSNGQLPTEQRWPFGDGPGQEAYLPAGKTRMMRTKVLLDYLEKYPPKGRGPARSAGNASSES